MTDATEFVARAIDTTSGTLREQVGPFRTREEAEEALDGLRGKWELATKYAVVEREAASGQGAARRCPRGA